jgi:integrase
MSYFKLTDKPHGKPRKKKWCVEWKEAGKKRRKLFKTETEAKEFDEDNNSRIRRTGLGLLGVRELTRYSATGIIRSYMHSDRLTEGDQLFDDKEKLEETTDLPNNVFLHLWGLSSRKEFEASLFDFNEQVAERYKDARLLETYTTYNTNTEKQLSPRTVRWEISHLQKAWQWARKNIPDLSHLKNPWEGLRIKGSTGGRQKRSLREGELQSLLDKCKGCLGVNRYYVPLAIYLAIDTGMRRQEIINLTWEDVDFENRRIIIRKSKTDWTARDKGKESGRIIVLPLTSDNLLGHLALSLELYGRLPGSDMVVTEPGLPSGRIFPMTGEAFYQAFRDVRRNAKLEHITFRSTLRTTANMMFFKARLDDDERDIMMGHDNKKDTGTRFYRDDVEFLPEILNKLDQYQRGELSKQLERAESVHQQEFESLCEAGIAEGLTKEDAQEKATATMMERLGISQFLAVVEDTIRTSPPS